MNTHQTCHECHGTGTIEREVCISEWKPRKSHDRHDELAEIVADAVKAKADHKRLCELNPRASESYDNQLFKTLQKLESAANSIL